MLSVLRKDSSNSRYDGVHTLLLLAGAGIGLLLLTLWSKTLQPPTSIPPVLQTVMPWLVSNVLPEPQEHTLFTFGFFLIPLCSIGIWLVSRRFFLQMDSTTAVRIAAICASIGIILWLVAVTMISHVTLFDVTAAWYVQPWMKLFPLTVSSIIAMILGVIALFIPWNGKKKITLPYPLLWEVIGIGAIVTFLAYDPLSLLPFPVTASSDDMWFIMPSWDILHGKELLVTSEAQYGLGIFYGLAVIFHFIGTSIQNLKLVEMLAHGVYYSAVYLLLRMICKTRSGAFIAFLFVLGGTIFRNELRFETYAEPSMTRLRNIWDIFLLLSFFKENQTNDKRWFFLSCALAALAFLYNTDIGMSLTVLTLVWACVLPFFRQLSTMQRVKAIGWRAGLVALSITTAIGLFSMGTHMASGTWPDWSMNFFYVRLYLAGFGSMPIPIVGAYWAVLGIEMTAIITACWCWLTGRSLRIAPFLLIVGLYGFLAFNYYLNRSFISLLWAVTLPACLCAVLLFQTYRNHCKEEDPGTLASPVVRYPLTFLAGIVLGINFWIVGIGSWTLAVSRYSTTPTITPDTMLLAKIQTSAQAISTRVPDGERAAIISLREPVYLLEANRASAFHVPMLEMVFTTDKMKTILETFLKENHPYLFVEHTYERCPMCDAVKSELLPFYTFEETDGLLDIYRRNKESYLLSEDF